eukprot:tig00020849_g14653.t1
MAVPGVRAVPAAGVVEERGSGSGSDEEERFVGPVIVRRDIGAVLWRAFPGRCRHGGLQPDAEVLRRLEYMSVVGDVAHRAKEYLQSDYIVQLSSDFVDVELRCFAATHGRLLLDLGDVQALLRVATEVTVEAVEVAGFEGIVPVLRGGGSERCPWRLCAVGRLNASASVAQMVFPTRRAALRAAARVLVELLDSH